MSTGCGCHFADSPHLATSCVSNAATNISLFMSFVDLMLRTNCAISDPCNRATDSYFDRQLDNNFDFIVVGGGVAGAVVAGRLSEEEHWRVLLLEAGPEEPTTAAVPAFAMSAVGTALDWGFHTEPERGACLSTGGVCYWPRGKMLAGTGAMTGMMYTRGHRELYDGWAAAGNAGWSYEEVLPYFIKAENNRNPELIEAEYHGDEGPLTVQQYSHRPRLADDIVAAAEEIGYRSGDLNGHNQTGFAVAQMMVDGGLRASSARMYLRANKKRKNLVVRINSQVTKVAIDRITRRATAVEFRDSQGNTHRVRARKEIVLSAGAIGSPHLLLLSGVGPRAMLKKFRIPVAQNLPVGKNLHNHVALGVKFWINDNDKRMLTRSALQQFMDTRQGPMASTGLTQVTGFIRSSLAGEMPDLQFFFDGWGARCSASGSEGECSDGRMKKNCGRRSITMRPTNVVPRSSGYLSLRSLDPLKPPALYPNYLSDKNNHDVKLLLEGVRFTQKLARSKILRRWGMELDKTPALGCEHEVFDSDQYWECVVRWHTGPENHQAGSCRMGPVGDPTAVVDPELRVHGITNLRVADASVFPLAPNANTVAGVVMVAEKAADMIRAAWS